MYHKIAQAYCVGVVTRGETHMIIYRVGIQQCTSLPTAIFSEVQTKPNSMEDLQRMFNQSYFNQTSLSPAISGRICAPNFENNKNWMIYHTVVRFGLSFLIPLLIMIGCNVGMISALFTVVRNQSYRRKKSFLGTRKRRITKVSIYSK